MSLRSNEVNLSIANVDRLSPGLALFAGAYLIFSPAIPRINNIQDISMRLRRWGTPHISTWSARPTGDDANPTGRPEPFRENAHGKGEAFKDAVRCGFNIVFKALLKFHVRTC